MVIPFSIGSLCRRKYEINAIDPKAGAGLTMASVYSKVVLVDFTNLTISDIKEVLFSDEQKDGKMIYTSEIINTSSFNNSNYPDIVDFFSNYISYSVDLRLFSNTFSSDVTLEFPFSQINVPSADCNSTNFSSYLLYKDSIIGKQYRNKYITNGLDPLSSVSEGYYNALFCVTFHYDKNTKKSFVCIYFPVTYPSYVTYAVYVVNINKVYTNCCLSACVEPNKYIFCNFS